MIPAKLKCLVLPAIFALTSSDALATNSPPVVTLTQPLSNGVFAAASDITLKAVASDGDGSVMLVEFFEGLNKLGESTNSPYSLVWSNVPSGSYSFTAKATDNLGATTTSAWPSSRPCSPDRGTASAPPPRARSPASITRSVSGSSTPAAMRLGPS